MVALKHIEPDFGTSAKMFSTHSISANSGINNAFMQMVKYVELYPKSSNATLECLTIAVPYLRLSGYIILKPAHFSSIHDKYTRNRVGFETLLTTWSV